ncbi:MAG: hypothetical protein ABIT37_25105 [Luteolibacter sp.]
MRLLPLVFVSLFTIAVATGQGSYQSEFYAAKNLGKTDPQAAIEGMKRGFHLAVEAGNADYATAAGLNGAYLMYENGKRVEAGRFAREVITALDALDDETAGGDALRRVQLFGLMERGLHTEGKIGAAWQANRAAAETLRGKKLTADGDGRPITVEELKNLPPALRSFGWRLVERESDMLDFVGRSLEARALLEQAVAALGDDWQRIPKLEQFYAFKLRARLCELLDYLGYEKQAIDTQQALLVSGADLVEVRSSHLTLQINLLRNLSQWDGPSEKLLEHARGIGARIEASNSGNTAARLLAKMELDLRQSQEALDALKADAKKQNALGQFLESAYADRDSLVSRAESGEANLDPEFIALLAKMRAQGNKRGEPNLYKEYGSYLMTRNRPSEATPLFQEALRLKRSFGLILHEPALLSSIFNARIASGDIDGAKGTLAELDAFITRYEKELPAARRVLAEIFRASALGKLGEKDAAKASLALARRLAVDLPEYRRRLLQPDQEEGIINPDKTAPPATTVATRLRIQPLEVVTVIAPKMEAHTRFVLTNPNPAGVRGLWLITGPGAVATTAGDVHFTAGKPDATLPVAQAVPSGGESVIMVAMTAADSIDAAKVSVVWRQPGVADSEASTWNVQWSADNAGRVVLDASQIEANPFRSISLFHEMAVPIGEITGIPFRLKSPVPLRFEYYDPATQELLAIDANGNGDFTETGDLHNRGPSGIACAMAPVKSAAATITVEIRIFAPSGDALAITPALVLETEIYRNNTWIKEAESVLK